MLKVLRFTLILIFLIPFTVEAQFRSLSDEAEISILTIGPGDQLYDKFGHSAFRVKDSSQEFDIVFNYGVYDFNTPNFYTKFAQGKLPYQLGVGYFEGFFESYKQQNRWVKEQVLNLSYAEKQALFRFLQKNALPENREYQYDFFYDNCATKIRDVLKNVVGEDLTYNDDFKEEQYTFRELIQQNVHWNTWGSLGMDVAIGAVVDQPATAWEYQFLPDYVFQAAATATLQKNGATEALVKETKTLFENTPRDATPFFFTSPLFIFLLIAAFILWRTVSDAKQIGRCRRMDGGLFAITGIIGIILSLLWFATDHSATANNYNLLWAFPINIGIAWAVSRPYPKKWVRQYVFFLVLLLALLCIHWITGVQAFPKALIPFFLALAVRYIFLLWYLKRKPQSPTIEG
ncbi:DUF4105 domain-containing protein [Flavobacteriaceae bacterium TK19130]|nr:DUF4105 domain-containing protein [Thermobacterium salinum]